MHKAARRTKTKQRIKQNQKQQKIKYVRVDGNENIIFYIYDKEQSGCWIPSQCFCDPYARNPEWLKETSIFNRPK